MAHKSKTQRAKAAVDKANKRDRELRDEIAAENAPEEKPVVEESKGGLFKKKADKPEAKQQAAAAKKETKSKKRFKFLDRFQFFKDVRAEMKRVTWPTRTDVIRWTGVVVGALVFFGVYVAILDHIIISPALVALSGLGG